MLGKRLINSNDAAAGGSSCTTNTNDYPTTNVAYYKMSSAADEKDTYNGTATNVNFNVQGKFGNAGEFNGSSSKIDLPNGAGSTGAITVSTWINTNNISTTQGIWSFGSTAGYAVECLIESGYLFFRMLNSSGTAGFGIQTATGYISNNTWHNIVCIFPNTTASNACKIYIDGVERITGTSTLGSVTRNTSNSGLGGRFYSGSLSLPFTGKIDQVRIFDSALNASQVASLYNEIQCVPTIVPSDNFNTVLYTGNGSTQAITNVGFEPNLTWIKSRSTTGFNVLFDSVRGFNFLSSNATSAEDTTNVVTLASYDSNGFTTGNDNGTINGNANNYVSWNWKAGGAAVSNTDGTITSQVSANVDAGFSIVKHTGNGSTGTVGTGLSSTAELIIRKDLDAATDWWVYAPASPYYGYLNYTDAFSSASNAAYSYNQTTPTGTVFSVANTYSGNVNNNNYIAYAFHSVDGFSKIGSYVGTGSTNGPTVVTGFRPAFVMFKVTSEADHWIMFDNKRGVVSDSTGTYLLANLSQAEGSISPSNIKFLSNGFEITGSATYWNKANASYIFMAFAEEGLPYVTRNATNPFGDSSELALYKFEDNANDAEGNYNGTASNVTYASGYIDKAAVFNGSSSQIAVAKISQLTDDVSVSLWVNLASTSSGSYLRMFSLNAVQNGWAGTLAVRHQPNSGNFNIAVGNGNSAETAVLNHTYALTQSTWYHICITRNDSTNVTKLYINGSEEDSETVSATATIQSNASSSIGTSVPIYGPTVWNGSIDQVRIFNRALDSGEVTALYNE